VKNRIVPLATAVVAVSIVVVGLVPPSASADLLPSRNACQGQKNARADERQQERALRCVVEHVRLAAGAGRLSAHSALERAAGRKVKDVARCGFTHTACGRAADAWPKHFGYDSASSWRWGENLATGKGRMTAREAVKAWLNSPPHRGTIMQGSYEHIGAAMRRSGNSTFWVLQVGCHGC
jgi:uncharacterized protein YkwD